MDYVQHVGNGCLFAAIKVLSIDTLSRTRLVQPQVLSRQYREALHLLNSALSSSNESRMDSTLIATLISELYHSMTCTYITPANCGVFHEVCAIEAKLCSNRSLDGWQIHAQGACALLQSRGPCQVTSIMGGSLFFQVSCQIFTHCLLARTMIPNELKRLRIAVQRHVLDLDYPLWRFHGLMIYFIDHLAIASAYLNTNTPDLARGRSLILDAFKIYEDLTLLFESASAMWKYDTIACKKFDGLVTREHIYHSFQAGQMWNGYRAATIMIFDAVTSLIDCFPCQYRDGVWLDAKIQPLVDNATAIIKSTALEMMAAIPDQMASSELKVLKPKHAVLRYCKNARRNTYLIRNRVFKLQPEDEQSLPYAQFLVGGCLLQWPLFIAARCRLLDGSTRQCLLHILDGVGDAMGISQWKFLADKLRLEQADLDLEYDLKYAHSPSMAQNTSLKT